MTSITAETSLDTGVTPPIPVCGPRRSKVSRRAPDEPFSGENFPGQPLPLKQICVL